MDLTSYFVQEQARQLLDASPTTKFYGEVTFCGVTVCMGFKTAREYLALLDMIYKEAEETDSGAIHMRMKFLSDVMKPTKLGSPFFIPKTQKKVVRKIAHHFVAAGDTVDDALIESIIDEFIKGALTLIHKQVVPLDLGNNLKFGIVQDHVTEDEFFSAFKQSVNMCFGEDCQEQATKTCAGCGFAKYCSRACQIKAWKFGNHKLRCFPA